MKCFTLGLVLIWNLLAACAPTPSALDLNATVQAAVAATLAAPTVKTSTAQTGTTVAPVPTVATAGAPKAPATSTPTVLSTPPKTLTATPNGQMKIGDYVMFGRYADKPILWRVIEDSDNPDAKVGDVIAGNPLLFGDKIIGKKPFDAAGPHGDDSERLKGGSNLWQTSNLRAWLNSSAEAGAVIWPCGNPPTNDKVVSNGYAGEKGFLATGNFTDSERNLIKPVTQKTLLYGVDYKLAEGGSEAYNYGDTLDNIVANYDNAYYHKLTDLVFLLDPKQVSVVGNLFGVFYINGLDNYWLRAPDNWMYRDSSAANVLYVTVGALVYYKAANSGDIGVRPALTLNLEAVAFVGGDGSQNNPHVVTGK